MVSANVCRERSAKVNQIVKKFLSLEFARTQLLVFFALQETCSRDVQNLSLHYFAYRFCKIQRCTAVLFGSVFVMAVFAPDSDKDPEEYEWTMLFYSKEEGMGRKEARITKKQELISKRQRWTRKEMHKNVDFETQSFTNAVEHPIAPSAWQSLSLINCQILASLFMFFPIH